jgi:uncharacterized protein (DUF4213/DUF364 family)
MALKLQGKLHDLLAGEAATRRISEVRIGLGYSAVQLDDGTAGLAWTPPPQGCGCTHLNFAGTLAGRSATELLTMLTDERALPRTLGLATANALLAKRSLPNVTKDEALSLLNVTAEDHVVMIGYFGPLVKGLKEIGCRLEIVELNPERPADLNAEQGMKALAACDIAIVTGTSLITGTIDGLLESMDSPRGAVLLGPSAPLLPELFVGTPFTQISGARVTEPSAALRVVSEGGGTPLLKRHVAFETLLLETDRT